MRCGGGVQYNPKVVIGNQVTIGQNCHVTCANNIEIGNGSSILPDVLITDIEHEYVPDKSLRDTGIQVGGVKIGSHTTIGMGSRILGNRGIIIGKNVVIGANSVVKEDIPDYVVAAGTPARIVRQYNFETKQWEKKA